MRLTREQLARLRHRHLGYRITLVLELAFLLCLPLAQRVSWLLAVMLMAFAIELMVFVSRFSPLKHTRSVVYVLGTLACVLEVLWHLSSAMQPALARVLTVPHVLVWVLFLVLATVRKVRSLTREPYVTVSVVLGAASGYLTVGLAGGVLLNALWTLDPSAFNTNLILSGADLNTAAPLMTTAPLMTVAPALMAASFGLLTTAGTSLLSASSVSAQVVANVITITGQLYVAILIALILGRFHQRF